MLIVDLRLGESIQILKDIRMTVSYVGSVNCKLAFDSPPGKHRILRSEIARELANGHAIGDTIPAHGKTLSKKAATP